MLYLGGALGEMSEVGHRKILLPVIITIRFLENALYIGKCFDGVNIV